MHHYHQQGAYPQPGVGDAAYASQQYRSSDPGGRKAGSQYQHTGSNAHPPKQPQPQQQQPQQQQMPPGGPQVAPTQTMPGNAPNTHQFKVSGTVFEVDKRYTLIRPVGSGAYGVVIAAQDSVSRQKVAIKKVPRAFDDIVDAKRILREIKLLRHCHHENIIGLLDILPPPLGLDHFEDVYMVVDLMETDLHRIIYSRQPLSLDHVQYFVYQLLRALKYMHSANVLHRDLKPSNLLLNSNCDLKVCDLGLARLLGSPHDAALQPQDLTEYVVTRWYRAPEIMLACQEYTKAIDIWSVGCIFAELLARQPMFPGNDYIDQLRIICSKLGRPPEEDLIFVTSPRAKRFIMSLPATPPTPLSQLFPDTDERALDLLNRMLQFNPSKRITAADALRHPFMESLHSEADEPDRKGEPITFEFEGEELDKKRLQYLIFLEMLNFHPEWRERMPAHPPMPRFPSTTRSTGGAQQQQQPAQQQQRMAPPDAHGPPMGGVMPGHMQPQLATQMPMGMPMPYAPQGQYLPPPPQQHQHTHPPHPQYQQQQAMMMQGMNPMGMAPSAPGVNMMIHNVGNPQPQEQQMDLMSGGGGGSSNIDPSGRRMSL